MTIRARRVFYSLATVVFLIVGPSLLAVASGYRWAGGGRGFVKTGALFITSVGRAEVRLNGEDRGSTPKRFTHLTPGVYVVELRQAGSAPWQKIVRVAPEVASVIGPVALFPAQFQTKNLDSKQSAAIVSDPAATVAVGVSPSDQEWVAADLWSATMTTATLPKQPRAFLISPHDQVRVWQLPDQLAVRRRNSIDPPWLIERLTNIRWDTNSDQIFYGQAGRSIYRFDALAQTRTLLAAADSFTIANDELWTAEYQPTVTLLAHQALYGQAVAQPATNLPGRWDVVRSPATVILLQRQLDGLLADYRLTASGPVLRPLGSADDWWWLNGDEPPLWQRGVDLSMRLADGRTTLVDRGSSAYTNASWLVPGHILLTFDDRHLVIRSVSDRQGRAVLMQQTFDHDQRLLVVDRAKRLAVLQPVNQPTALTVYSWAPTTR